MGAVVIFFNNVPDAFRDTLGQAFEVESLEDFLYENSDVLPGATLSADGSTLFYSDGTDSDGFATWDFARIQILPHDDGGSDGGE
jgi:hypothetical protein